MRTSPWASPSQHTPAIHIVFAVSVLALEAFALSAVSCDTAGYSDKGDYARDWLGDYSGSSNIYVASTKTTYEKALTTLTIMETDENRLSVTVRLYVPSTDVHELEFNDVHVGSGSSLSMTTTRAFQIQACYLSRNGNALSGTASLSILGEDDVCRAVYIADPLLVTRRVQLRQTAR